MNIKGLRVFISIMATGSLVAAAREMNTSVSALSRQLSLLEAELDMQLFNRDKKRLTPTDRARAFRPEVEKLLATFDEIPDRAEEIKRLPARRLRIGVMPRMAACIVEPAVARYMKMDPTADIIIDIQPRRDLEQGLLEKTFDLGFGSIPANHQNITVMPICRVPAVVIMNPNHRYAQRRTIMLDDLLDEDFIIMPPSTLLGRTMLEMLNSKNIDIRSRLQVTQTSSCCNLIANGYGISLSDAMIPAFMREDIKLLPLRPKHMFEFGILYLEEAEEVQEASDMLDVIRDEAAKFAKSMTI